MHGCLGNCTIACRHNIKPSMFVFIYQETSLPRILLSRCWAWIPIEGPPLKASSNTLSSGAWRRSCSSFRWVTSLLDIFTTCCKVLFFYSVNDVVQTSPYLNHIIVCVNSVPQCSATSWYVVNNVYSSLIVTYSFISFWINKFVVAFRTWATG